jgi:hypothetical protein
VPTSMGARSSTYSFRGPISHTRTKARFLVLGVCTSFNADSMKVNRRSEACVIAHFEHCPQVGLTESHSVVSLVNG